MCFGIILILLQEENIAIISAIKNSGNVKLLMVKGKIVLVFCFSSFFFSSQGFQDWFVLAEFGVRLLAQCLE